MVPPTGYVSDHHVGHWHDLAILGLLNKDSYAASNEFTVKLDALGASNELAIRVVSCIGRDKRNGFGTVGVLLCRVRYYKIIPESPLSFNCPVICGQC